MLLADYAEGSDSNLQGESLARGHKLLSMYTVE